MDERINTEDIKDDFSNCSKLTLRIFLFDRGGAKNLRILEILSF